MKRLILILMVVAFTISCKKQSKKESYWTTYISSIHSTSFSETTIVADYELGGNKSQITVGVFYSENEEASYGNSSVIEVTSFNEADDRKVFYLENLSGQTTYFVRGFIQGVSGVIVSEAVSFKTLPLPELECSYTPSIIDFGFTSVEFDDLELTEDDGYWFLTGDGGTDLGDISFKLGEKPRSTIYHVTESENFSGEKAIYVSGQMPMPHNCFFYAKDYENSNIQIVKNEDETYSIKFCDVKLRLKFPTGGCPGSYYISGNLKG